MTTLGTFLQEIGQKTKYGEPLKFNIYDYDTALSTSPIRSLSYNVNALTDLAQIDAVKKFILDYARGSHDVGNYGSYIVIYGTNPNRLLGRLWFSEVQMFV